MQCISLYYVALHFKKNVLHCNTLSRTLQKGEKTMPQISLRIPKELDKKLELKVKEMNLLKKSDETKSDVIRALLWSALEGDAASPTSKLNAKELQCLVTTYQLLNEYILSLGDKGTKMNNQAHEKANKILAAMMKKS